MNRDLLSRGWDKILNNANAYDNDASFFSNTNFTVSNFGGTIRDTRIDPQTLNKVFLNDPICTAVYQKIQAFLMTNGFNVYYKKKNGKFETNSSTKAATRLLQSQGLSDMIMNGALPAYYGTGGGNALGYKEGKQYKLDPFMRNGKDRVEVITDAKNDNEILGYKILANTGKPIKTISKSKAYHFRYTNPAADPVFSISPAVSLSKWLSLKYHIMQGNDEIFARGMMAAMVVGLDAQSMKTQSGVYNSRDTIQKAQTLLRKQIAELQRVKSRNRILTTDVPITMQKIQMNNSEMRGIELLDYIDLQLIQGFGFDPSFLDNSNSKYNNAQFGIDAAYRQMRPFFILIENFAKNFLLGGILDDRYVVRIARDINSEELEIKRAKDEETTAYFNNIKTFNETFAGNGIVITPTADKVAELTQQGYQVVEVGTPVAISSDVEDNQQVADSFTGMTINENVHRSTKQTQSFWDTAKIKLDRSFKKVLDRA